MSPEEIATAWFAAFNAHDLEALLALYADDAEHYSPKLKAREPATGGLIRGKEALRNWWKGSFERLPSLHYRVTTLYKLITGRKMVLTALARTTKPMGSIHDIKEKS